MRNYRLTHPPTAGRDFHKVMGRRFIQILVLISILCCSRALAEELKYPNYAGYVNDFANCLSPDEKAKLTALLGELERKTTAQLAILTVATSQPMPIETYAIEIFNRWGIGQKGKENGALIVLALKDRKVWIETGLGLEGALPDAFCSQVYRDILVPSFRRGEFGKGLLAAAAALAEKIGREYNVDLSEVLAKIPYQTVPHRPSPAKSIFSTLFTLLFFILIFGMRMGLFGFLLFGRPGYWGGGGFTGTGGFSGGFGGFGGGSCGGGGAGGGW